MLTLYEIHRHQTKQCKMKIIGQNTCIFTMNDFSLQCITKCICSFFVDAACIWAYNIGPPHPQVRNVIIDVNEQHQFFTFELYCRICGMKKFAHNETCTLFERTFLKIVGSILAKHMKIISDYSE